MAEVVLIMEAVVACEFGKTWLAKSFPKCLKTGLAIAKYINSRDDSNSRFKQEVREAFRASIEQIKLMELNLLNEIKSIDYINRIVYIDAIKNKVGLYIRSYGEQVLSSKLDRLITRYDEKNLEFELVGLLTAKVLGCKSFIDVYIEKIKEYPSKDDMKNTPHKIVYELFVFILEKIIDANNLHRFMIIWKDEINGVESVQDLDYVTGRKNSAIINLKAAIASAFGNFDSPECLIYYSPLVYEKPDGVWRNLYDNFFVGEVNVPDGHVVTGARFQKRDDIIYLQLQSAKLLPFGLIGSMTWIELPSSGKFSTFTVLATCYGSFTDPNVALTGVRIFQQSVKNECSLIFGWIKVDETVSVPMLELIGKRMNYAEGTLENERRTLALIPRDSKVLRLEEKPGVVVIQEDRLAPSRCRDANHGINRSCYNNKFSEIESSLSAPISAINIMSYVKENSRHYKPYLKSLKYQGILEI